MANKVKLPTRPAVWVVPDPPPFALERPQPVCPKCGRSLPAPKSQDVGGPVQPDTFYPVACANPSYGQAPCGWTGQAQFLRTQGGS